MPVNFIGTVFLKGTSTIPYYDEIKTYGPYLGALSLAKWYFGGTANTWERDLHGRVALVTGGTSGVGAAVVKELATRGAQVIVLVRSAQDEWVQSYIEDVRDATGNFMVYAEECNLSELYSIRKFCTKWLDNSPPRRLDMVVCCAGVALPPYSLRSASLDGIEQHLAINYLAHYHLVTMLSPGLRVQPPDREVRVILTTCVSSVLADFDIDDLEFESRGYPRWMPWKVMGAAKLAQTMFAYEFQRHLNAYERPDKAPSNVHVAVVDPGMMRSPSLKRFLSLGTLWGLLGYLLLWPLWWLVLRTSIGGAQSLFYAIMSPEIAETSEVSYISDCRVRQAPPRKELADEQLQARLFEVTRKLVDDTEKKSVIAKKRAEAEQGKASKEGSEANASSTKGSTGSTSNGSGTATATAASTSNSKSRRSKKTRKA